MFSDYDYHLFMVSLISAEPCYLLIFVIIDYLFRTFCYNVVTYGLVLKPKNWNNLLVVFNDIYRKLFSRGTRISSIYCMLTIMSTYLRHHSFRLRLMTPHNTIVIPAFLYIVSPALPIYGTGIYLQDLSSCNMLNAFNIMLTKCIHVWMF